ncbi:hypothetical protein EAF04_004130 [Stromatinia cepivora]|nr:hypothetical protein EAF04_004130 [Stromatinia cepivora]
MSTAPVPNVNIALDNFLFNPDFPTELRFEVFEFIPLIITIFGDPPPLLFALHGTEFYRFVQGRCRRLNFFLTNGTIERFRTTNNSNGLGDIQYLYISSTEAFSTSVTYHCPLRAHVSMFANNFVEINVVLKSSLTDTEPHHDWHNSLCMVDHVIQIAARSTAEKTVVRLRVLPAPKDRSFQSQIEDVKFESCRAQERYTAGKSWSVGRRESRGVDPVQEIWVWEVVKDSI